jgi:antitoxin (DNA-binding transcriptional repressor) of toxin-antitoxin stability system
MSMDVALTSVALAYLREKGDREAAERVARYLAPDADSVGERLTVRECKARLSEVLARARAGEVALVSPRARTEDGVLVVGVACLAREFDEFVLEMERQAAAEDPMVMLAAADRLPPVTAPLEIDPGTHHARHELELG